MRHLRTFGLIGLLVVVGASLSASAAPNVYHVNGCHRSFVADETVSLPHALVCTPQQHIEEMQRIINRAL